MKVCFVCNVPKDLDEFYKHSKMADGHLGKCKKCTKEQARLRDRYLKETDLDWVEKELERNRKKQALARKEGHAMPARSIDKAAWGKRNGEKKRAHLAVCRAIKKGDLVPQKCYCGAIAQAHHEDYTKPLEVIWLCTKHHAARHIEIRKQLRQKTFYQQSKIT